MNSPRTCVVIEDDTDIRDLIALILTDAGFEVHACETGHDGVVAAERLNPDLITLDVGLPDMDGREAARLLAAVSPAPILMITAFAELDDELHAIASGATAYLIKPFRPRQLRELALQLSPHEPASGAVRPTPCVKP
ncbi:DNA-binding response OmpR family regulator [Paenarthrobacter nicotinovorans]|uniref:Response regulator transcription factor n=1 Tax=Paenarthrobacter nicotinovorans TaxID=29320 RepID=A0ABV0GXI6_PAENI|nr:MULTISPECIES: response regulator transcription factor [Micrococcaceae]MDR6438804.1 DNA-binding response OmpR family regulator [Paenarthrobacter nicotinovorans]SCZ56253.1 Response regulator receiver domain-containing protein [Arthrobacter sp. UNCCL28]